MKIKIVAIIAATAAVLFLLTGALLWAVQISHAVARLEENEQFCDKVETLRLPLEFLTSEPDCANRLLESLGVETVKLATTHP